MQLRQNVGRVFTEDWHLGNSAVIVGTSGPGKEIFGMAWKLSLLAQGSSAQESRPCSCIVITEASLQTDPALKACTCGNQPFFMGNVIFKVLWLISWLRFTPSWLKIPQPDWGELMSLAWGALCQAGGRAPPWRPAWERILASPL